MSFRILQVNNKSSIAETHDKRWIIENTGAEVKITVSILLSSE